HGTLGVGQCLRSVSGAHQQNRIVDKDGRILRLEAEGAIEISAGLVDVGGFEFEVAGNEARRSAQLGVSFALQFRERLGVNLAILNNYLGKVALVRETVDRGESGKIAGSLVGAGGNEVDGHAARFNAVYRTLGNGIAVVANFVC